jgi:hypothetical protein
MVNCKFIIASLTLNQSRKFFLHILLNFIVWMKGDFTQPDVLIWATWYQNQQENNRKFSHANKKPQVMQGENVEAHFNFPQPNLDLVPPMEKRQWWPWGTASKNSLLQ